MILGVLIVDETLVFTILIKREVSRVGERNTVVYVIVFIMDVLLFSSYELTGICAVVTVAYNLIFGISKLIEPGFPVRACYCQCSDFVTWSGINYFTRRRVNNPI